ncbi:Fic family protein [Gordonibacter sp.]|uniref:Fic family protein n=1 Tax=Gordonibacter sp. TaxID=1968902 RepID=UPI002FCA0EF4
MSYEPPFQITADISTLSLEIAEMVGRLSPASDLSASPSLHRELRIKTIHSSLAIEQNTLTEDQVTDIIDGKRVLGPRNEIREVENAKRAYDLLESLDPLSIDDLLFAHGVMMEGFGQDAGRWRMKNAGVYDGDRLIHAGTPAAYVPEVMTDLFAWIKGTEVHPLIASCVFHYEFEFVHPFSDGNGRTGRLWHTLMLSHWRAVLAWLPVESMIHERQADYYAALNASNTQGSSTLFVGFMLEVIRDAMLPYCTPAAGLDSLRDRILNSLGRNPHATLPVIAKETGTSLRTVERTLATLKAEGALERVGSARKGFWKVKQNNSEH